MKRGVMVVVAALLLTTGTSLAQGKKSTRRIEIQHKLTYFQRNHIKQSEESLRDAIQSNSVDLQLTGVQTVRELEQLDEEYPFGLLIGPLSDRLKDEKADGEVRMLAALALDELHSEAGDAVIKSVAEKSSDPALKNLCGALLVRSWLESPPKTSMRNNPMGSELQ